MHTFLALIKFRHKPIKYAFGIGFSYLILCSLYIWLSGELAAAVAEDIKDLKNVELYKGLIFVVLTSIFIFQLCYVMFRKLALDAEELLRGQEVILQSEHKSAAGVFASCMAHDANNVLSVISLRTDQLKLMTPPESESAVVLDKLGDSVDKLIAMMVKLKSAGSSNLGVPQKFNFKKTFEESIDLINNHKSLLMTDLKVTALDGNYEYVGYPILFQQMIINLILNAAEAPRKSSVNQIFVQLKEIDNHIEIIVEDNGTGVPEEDKEKIFTAFYSTKKSGTGLGLMSVKACLDQHHGEIKLSQSHHGGVRIETTLPRTI